MKDTKSVKPSDVKWSEWDAPDKLNTRHEALVNFAILGYPTSVMAEKLGYSQEHVRKLLRAPNVQEKIKSERETRFASVLKERMDDLCGLASETLEKVLTSPDERGATKVQAATYLLDHAVGKAKASLEVKSTNLLAFIEHLDKNPRYTEPPPQDQFDEIIAEVIPENIVVGLRKKD